MQWILTALWSVIILRCSKRHPSAVRALISTGLAISMSMQICLLAMDGLFTWEAVLPLHLCSMFGVLCALFVRRTPALLYEAMCFLGAPAALITLFFATPAPCSHPMWMNFAFFQLHVLLALLPLHWHQTEKPLPADPRRTMVAGSGYLLFICGINRVFGTNYLFLRSAPLGTPLYWLQKHGQTVYLCALVMLCMTAFNCLSVLYTQSRK